MQQTQLGNTDIEVSKLCVGAMSFGQPGTMHDWTLNADETTKMVKTALDLGINFFDTANAYSKGTSETYLGQALRQNVSRDKVVIASKVYFNPGRLSRKAIEHEIDGSLKRLGTDYLDLYIIHRFDYDTPIEETMGALNDLVVSGKVRAIGASAMYAKQFNAMQQTAKEHDWATFQTMENHYNLLYREDEQTLIPACKQWGASLMPYSPLAAGHLSHTGWQTNTLRSRTDKVSKGKYDNVENIDLPIIDQVNTIAQKHDTTMSQVALAWLWAKGVAAPIVGATKTEHLRAAAAAQQLTLTPADIQALEAPYQPHPIVGALDQNPPAGTVLIDEKK
ncbi:aldo/keto reductase [Secundilactobacillus hailunensis]|uniref:Aldo/keto reductase n=1 Tax=Secundilactobacillus hailunensis TaxID=2559923 RepID=A0ABW1T7P3_9LACO|nr:aldo/keto reductase [Secundilactobacillus hailunensis]